LCRDPFGTCDKPLTGFKRGTTRLWESPEEAGKTFPEKTFPCGSFPGRRPCPLAQSAVVFPGHINILISTTAREIYIDKLLMIIILISTQGLPLGRKLSQFFFFFCLSRPEKLPQGKFFWGNQYIDKLLIIYIGIIGKAQRELLQ
jgi:hypothetical protein